MSGFILLHNCDMEELIFIIVTNQVGIYGWSYGGYLSAMALCRLPFCDTFKCAVAGAPVTSWDGYDTHYTGETLCGVVWCGVMWCSVM